MGDPSRSKTHVEYTTMVRYLSEKEACDGSVFDQSKLGQMLYLDTTHCVISKRKKKYNSFNIYAIFGSYIGKTPQAMKHLMLQELHSNELLYTHVGHTACGMRT